MSVRFNTLLLATILAAAGCRDATPTPVAVGTLERDRLELIAEAPEPIAGILVREGDHVASGQVLLRLDDTEFKAQVAQAESARDRARARLAELVRGPRPERIAEARAALAGAEGTLVTAHRDLDRARTLRKSGVDAQAGLDLAQARYDEALARRDQAQAVLDAMRNGTTAEELNQARAAVAEAEAAVAAIRVRADRLQVRAPQDGQVDALPYKLGERPPTGGVVAVVLADAAPYARVFVPEPIRVRVQPGMQATVRVDGIERTLHGRVRIVSHEAAFTPYYALTERDRGRLSYLAEVTLTDEEARGLPTGVPVQVTFDGESRERTDG
jgi:HlyD family secretion protein